MFSLNLQGLCLQLDLVFWMFEHLTVTYHSFHLFLHTYLVCVDHLVGGLWGFWLIVLLHQCRGRTWCFFAIFLCNAYVLHSWWSYFLKGQISSSTLSRILRGFLMFALNSLTQIFIALIYSLWLNFCFQSFSYYFVIFPFTIFPFIVY